MRVAQREHYLPGSVLRFAGRWWLGSPTDGALGAVAVAAAVAAWWWPVVAVVCAAAAALGPPRPRRPGTHRAAALDEAPADLGRRLGRSSPARSCWPGGSSASRRLSPRPSPSSLRSSSIWRWRWSHPSSVDWPIGYVQRPPPAWPGSGPPSWPSPDPSGRRRRRTMSPSWSGPLARSSPRRPASTTERAGPDRQREPGRRHRGLRGRDGHLRGGGDRRVVPVVPTRHRRHHRGRARPPRAVRQLRSGSSKPSPRYWSRPPPPSYRWTTVAWPRWPIGRRARGVRVVRCSTGDRAADVCVERTGTRVPPSVSVYVSGEPHSHGRGHAGRASSPRTWPAPSPWPSSSASTPRRSSSGSPTSTSPTTGCRWPGPRRASWWSTTPTTPTRAATAVALDTLVAAVDGAAAGWSGWPGTRRRRHARTSTGRGHTRPRRAGWSSARRESAFRSRPWPNGPPTCWSWVAPIGGRSSPAPARSTDRASRCAASATATLPWPGSAGTSARRRRAVRKRLAGPLPLAPPAARPAAGRADGCAPVPSMEEPPAVPEVAVIFGGPSPEHDVSILTGLQACRGLARDGATAQVRALFWSKTGEWFEVDPGARGRGVRGRPARRCQAPPVLGHGRGRVLRSGPTRPQPAARGRRRPPVLPRRPRRGRHAAGCARPRRHPLRRSDRGRRSSRHGQARLRGGDGRQRTPCSAPGPGRGRVPPRRAFRAPTSSSRGSVGRRSASMSSRTGIPPAPASRPTPTSGSGPWPSPTVPTSTTCSSPFAAGHRYSSRPSNDPSAPRRAATSWTTGTSMWPAREWPALHASFLPDCRRSSPPS